MARLASGHNRTTRVARKHTRSGICCLLLLLLLTTSATQATVSETSPQPVMIELHAPSLAQVLLTSQAQHRTIGPRETRTQLHQLIQTQDQLHRTLPAHATELYRMQRLYNGIAVSIDSAALPALQRNPLIKAIHPLTPMRRAGITTTLDIGAPAIWATRHADRPGTGTGVTIAVIDSGIDYTHAMFGGPGTQEAFMSNDPTIVEAGTFPTTKVIGGYDLVGENYDTARDPTAQPQPDPDPLDCAEDSHGTHIAGIAAGQGVTRDGNTFTGPYTAAQMRTLALAPGIAPEAQIYALRVFGCNGIGTLMVDAALEYAIDPNQDGDLRDRVDVINLSLGSDFGETNDSTMQSVAHATQLGSIVVAISGNLGDIAYATSSPATAPSAISTALTERQDGQDRPSVAAFSARGPRGGDALLKPDLAAPGMQIVSAAAGTGTGTVTFSGASYAAPAITGGMALLRQRYPDWSVADLKTLAMNTAVDVADDESPASSPVRVGAGQLALDRTITPTLLAASTTPPGATSISFGYSEVDHPITQTRDLAITNVGLVPQTATVTYRPVTTVTGATLTGPATPITIPAQATITVPVTLALDPAAMPRDIRGDPPLREIAGYLMLTSVEAPATPDPVLRVPVYGVVRPVTTLAVHPDPIMVTPALTATIAVTSTTTTPGQVSVFDLQYRSPHAEQPITDRWAHKVDLQYVGLTQVDPGTAAAVLFFGIVMQGPWSTPDPDALRIVIDLDTDGSGITDAGDGAEFQLANGYRAPDMDTDPPLVSILTDTRTETEQIQFPLNGAAPGSQERLYHTRVVALGVRLRELFPTTIPAQFTYQVRTTTRGFNDIDQQVSTTGPLTTTLTPGVTVAVTSPDTPLVPVAPTQPLELRINPATAPANVLVLMHDTAVAQQYAILPLARRQQWLPLIQ